ncbi:MAG: MotA/TolQ/ExbB proton channel family protein [Candidatus Adiutrix sp.]|jgi:biopolymer transport protein ExbB|nr:MotA/TolQ/ExbB proton channel family protein [Candidatus Adiutrix sp.]
MDLLTDLLSRGGWVMYPILACSLTGLGLVVERLWALRRSRVIPGSFLVSVSGLLDRRRYDEVAFLSQEAESSAARLVGLALKLAGRRRALFKDNMEEAGRREAAGLNAHLGALYLVASISPLLGLLGTVSGMISAFNSISTQGIGNPGLLAGGISEALLTTAAGLCVAIPALVAHRAILSRAESLTRDLEDLSADLLEALAAPEQGSPPPQPARPLAAGGSARAD